MKENSTSVAVVGDLVKSRDHNRATLHTLLTTTLNRIDTPARERFHPTVGDEIQGIFDTLSDALQACHLTRLHLLAEGADIRFGIGRGKISMIDAATNIQDGPAWWHARDALTEIEEIANAPAHAGLRTHVRTTTKDTAHSADEEMLPLNAMLHLIDAHVSSLKPGTCRSLLYILSGATNAEAAAELGITPSANTQRVILNHLRPLSEAITATWALNSHPQESTHAS